MPIRDEVPTFSPQGLNPLQGRFLMQPLFSNNAQVYYKPQTQTTGASNTVTTSRAKQRRC